MKKLENKIPPPIVLLLTLGMMALLNKASVFPRIEFNLPFWVGLLVAVGGVAIAVAGVVRFRAASTTVNPLKPESSSSLVTDGVFQYTRNPMYLGMLLVGIGYMLFLGNLVTLVGPAVLFLFLNRFQIQPEERAMHSLFKDEFAHYSKSTRRWI